MNSPGFYWLQGVCFEPMGIHKWSTLHDVFPISAPLIGWFRLRSTKREGHCRNLCFVLSWSQLSNWEGQYQIILFTVSILEMLMTYFHVLQTWVFANPKDDVPAGLDPLNGLNSCVWWLGDVDLARASSRRREAQNSWILIAPRLICISIVCTTLGHLRSSATL